MEHNTVFLSAFCGSDTLESISLAMQYLKDHPGTTLVMEPGVYTITSELAQWTRQSVLNGDFGSNPQRTMFHPKFPYTRGMDFAGQRGSRILAYGVTLMIDGFMEPVSLNHCENIELCGITIDHTRKPYTHGTVTSITYADDNNMIVSVTTGDAFPVTAGTSMTLRQRFYDPPKDCFLSTDSPKNWEWIDAHHLRLHMTRDDAVKAGMEYYCIHTYHYRPAILIEHAKNITLTDVTIHSQPGMGIVGNRSEDVLIRRLAIIPSAGEHWSTNTDATHFTSMKGTLRLENCISEAHGDDFVNVHAYYHDVIRREAPNVCYMQEKTPDGTHAQSLDYPDIGDTLELTSRDTLQVLDTFTVMDCVPMPEEWMCKVTLDHPLPDNTDGLMLADVTRLPRLEVVGCTITSHYARSILIKTRNVLIERNFFKNALGMAVEVAAEAGWYEGVGPADVVIRNNRIVNCGCREAAGVVVKADAEHAAGQSIYHVTIEDNIIDVPFAAHAIFVRNTDGVTIARNHCVCTETPIIVRDCKNVVCDNAYDA